MMVKRLLLLAFALCLCLASFPAAHAEDFFTLDVDTLDMDSLNSNDYVAQNLSSGAQGVRVVKYVSDSSELAQRVRLTLTQMDTQTLLMDKDYGFQSGTFDSGVLYLPYVDSRTVPYLVTLYVGDTVYAMPFMHLRSRLSHNGGCTRGVRLGDLDPMLYADWLMGTMIDLNSLRMSGSMQVDLCASARYVVGQATVTLYNDELVVQLGFSGDANAEVHNLSLYVITDCAGMTTADVNRMPQAAHSVGESVSVAGASSALLYMPMELSYDPASSLPTYAYDAGMSDVQYQLSLWRQNREAGALADVMPQGDGWSDGDPADNSWGGDSTDDGYAANGWANGWNDGWDDGASEGWDDGTSSDGWDDGQDAGPTGDGQSDSSSGDGWVEDSPAPELAPEG